MSTRLSSPSLTDSEHQVHVLNLGAGVQSTTLYLMSMEGAVSKFDYAIFADTGEEPQAVYQHLEWLKTLPGPKILVRDIGSRLGDDLKFGRRSKSAGRGGPLPPFRSIS